LGTLDHQTGILNAINSFASAGYQVEVLAVRNLYHGEPKFESPAIRLRFMPWTFSSEREPRSLVTILFTLWVVCTFWRSHPLIFAGGIRGLVAAYCYSLLRRTRVINYQTELYLGSKLDSRFAALLKAVERRAAQGSELSIEHTEERRKLLAEDLGLSCERIAIVPNAPLGPARAVESRFLHERLGLPPETKILLCPGTFGETFATSSVVRAAQGLPPGWVAVLHSAQRRAEDDPYVGELKKIDSAGRVVFSLQPVPYDQIDSLMASARVGLALYSATDGDNYSTVGLSSGKLSHFLRVGVPVIVSPLPGLADFVLANGVGQVLEERSALSDLVMSIERDYAGYRTRSLNCFDQHLAYERSFRQVIDWVEKSPRQIGA
jgi:glycosyltransferase involved in cell wall biosynthesis